MKKKKDWITKAKKREVRKKDGGVVDLIRIMHHFFKKLPQWIDEMKDPRNPSYITYTLKSRQIIHRLQCDLV